MRIPFLHQLSSGSSKHIQVGDNSEFKSDFKLGELRTQYNYTAAERVPGFGVYSDSWRLTYRIIMELTVMSCEVRTHLLQRRTFRLIIRRDKLYPQMQLCADTGVYYRGLENDHNI